MGEIESNIPVPGWQGGAPLKHPWDRLGVGDSIVVSASGRRAAFLYAARHKLKFTSRALPNDQYRVWRLM